MARGAGGAAAGDPGPHRRRAALGRGRGRRPAARRARHAASGGRRRGLHRAGRRPAGRPGLAGTPAPTGRSPIAEVAARFGLGTAVARCGDRAGWSAPGGSSRASCDPSGAGARAVRRRGAADAAPPVARRAAPARSSRSRPATWPGSCRSGRAWRGGTAAASTACSARSSSWRARSCRAARSRRWCCRTGSPGTRPRCSTSSPRPARCSGPGRVAAGRRRLGVAAPRPTRAPLTLPAPAELAADRAPTRRCWTRLSTAGAFFFRDPVRRRSGSTGRRAALAAALWDLVWSGRLTRRHPRTVARSARRWSTAHRRRGRPRRSRYAVRGAARTRVGRRPSAPRGPDAQPHRVRRHRPGRWSLLPAARARPHRAGLHALAEPLLDRHGVVTRGAVAAEGVAGRVRRGLPGPVARSRTPVASAAATSSRASGPRSSPRPGAGGPARAAARHRRRPARAEPRCVLAADRPGQPVRRRAAVAGRAAGPTRRRQCALRGRRPAAAGQHRPGRKAGALVVLVRRGAVALRRARRPDPALVHRRPSTAFRPRPTRSPSPSATARSASSTVERADGAGLLSGSVAVQPRWFRATPRGCGCGFHATPRGLRLRRQARTGARGRHGLAHRAPAARGAGRPAR